MDWKERNKTVFVMTLLNVQNNQQNKTKITTGTNK